MIFITLGDPVSIFGECLIPLLSKLSRSFPVVLVGSRKLWMDQLKFFGHPELLGEPMKKITDHQHQVGMKFFDIAAGLRKKAENLSETERGTLALDALLALKQVNLKRHAVLTGPINKYNAQLAGFSYPGHTEFFSVLGGAEALMYFSGKHLKVGLATSHVPLNKVAATVDTHLLSRKILQLFDVLSRLERVALPKLAICGLNPHASDGGLFGDEEEKIIIPAIEQARKKLGDQAVLEGPLAADAAFYLAGKKDYDGVLALYHDQGLAPLKLVDFASAVNISWGLPFLRVSPDHGPGTNLFLQGNADPRSTKRALDFCKRYLLSQRQG